MSYRRFQKPDCPAIPYALKPAALLAFAFILLILLFTSGCASKFKDGVSEDNTFEYSEGLVWIEKGDTWYCFNTEGEVAFKLEKWDRPKTSFKNGVALIENDRLVGRDGETVFSLQDEPAYDSMFVLEPKEEFSGYVFVSKYTSNYYEEKDEWGMLNPDGTLRHALSSEFMSCFYGCEYIGKGIFRLADRDYDDYYNYDYNDGNPEKYYNIVSDDFFSMDYSDMEFCLSESEGLAFRDTGEGKGFVDKDSNMAIDMSGYDICSKGSLRYIDGVCTIVARGADGNLYYITIDKAGNELFEPILCEIRDFGDESIIMNEGLVAMNGAYCYQRTGEAAFELPEYGPSAKGPNLGEFHDGVARIETLKYKQSLFGGNYETDQVYYINTKGEPIHFDFNLSLIDSLRTKYEERQRNNFFEGFAYAIISQPFFWIIFAVMIIISIASFVKGEIGTGVVFILIAVLLPIMAMVAILAIAVVILLVIFLIAALI